ncbi:S-layer homology domain-containing protein [Paenibacillus sp. yr247]|uniref:S-layer homology domain-containing protein n=1 Tax=Paenibacillus sp. yr247 TaxID=1761880 RepID=UPI00088C9E2C|nr:S-layer homology domain-containing protein [Paenibacillus sp. yr247]SDO28142.1 S-layer homology domain-containing protein [Paenibacillus sp. yr247]
MRKRFFIILSAVLCAASIGYDAINSSAQSPIKFTDTSQHWAEQSIQNAVEKKYVDGYEDGSFKPDEPISRAEFIKMLSSATGEKVNKVEGNDWYVPYVYKLKELSIIPVEFPERYTEPLQRFEMAMLSARSVDKALKGTMLDAVKIGLIHGINTTDLAPYGSSTRAQAITVIERILSAKKGEKLPLDKYAISQALIEATNSNVEYALGLKSQNIGKTWSAGQGATVTLDRVVIADPSNENDPYMAYIDTSNWYRNVDKNRDVVVLSKFTVKVDKSADNNFNLFVNQYITLYDRTGTLLLSKDGLPRTIRFAVPGSYSGYLAYGINRVDAKTGLTFDMVGNKVVIAKP